MIDVRGLVGEDGGVGDAGSSAGSRRPLPEVFAELAPRLRRLAARRVGENLADDVVQETFLRAHRAYDRYVDDGRSWAWVRNIAEHVCIDLVRRSRIEAAAVERVSSYRYASPADETFASVEAHEDRKAMAAVLAQLHPRQRRVLVLRDFHGWSTYEVATALGMTVDGVKATLKRARGTFRTAYAGLAGGRYVAGVLGAIAAMRRALRRTTAATTGSVNVVLVSAIVVVTTLTLGLPVTPFEPDVDAVRDGVAQSASSSVAAPRAFAGHANVGGSARAPFGSGLDLEPDVMPAFDTGLNDAVGAGHGGVAPVNGAPWLDGDEPAAIDDGDAVPVGDAAPPSLEVGTELSPTCDLVEGVGEIDDDEACAQLDQNVTVPMSPPSDSDSAPVGPALPLALATASPDVDMPRTAMPMSRSASTSVRVSSDPADDTLEASPTDEVPVVEEVLADVSLPSQPS